MFPATAHRLKVRKQVTAVKYLASTGNSRCACRISAENKMIHPLQYLLRILPVILDTSQHLKT